VKLGQFLHDRYFKSLSYPGFYVESGSTASDGGYFEEALGWRGVNIGVRSLRELVEEQRIREVDLMILDSRDSELPALQEAAGSRALPRVLCVRQSDPSQDALRPALEALGYTYDASGPGASVWLRTHFPR
jgi:hypothetical protein